MTSSGLSPEMMLGGAVLGGLLIISLIYFISTLFQALFIKLGLKWVSRLGVGFGSAFVTALCINVLGFLVTIATAKISQNQLVTGQAGILINLLVGTVLISKRHHVTWLDGVLVELISIALSFLMGIAAMVMLGLVFFLIAMGMQTV